MMKRQSPGRAASPSLSDDSVRVVEPPPIEMIEIRSTSSSEYAEVMDRKTMTDRETKMSSDQFRNMFAKVWCETEPASVLCSNAFLIFKMHFMRRHGRLRIDVEERATRIWNRMSHEQRLPFKTGAFIAQYICACSNDNFEENARNYFRHLSRGQM